MKKIFLVVSVLSFFALVPHVLAEGFVPLAPIPGLTEGAVANSSGLANFLNNLYKYLIGAAAALAVVEIIWGGLEISTKDSVSKHSDGKERIQQAILGLVLVLSPVLVFSIINPSILNLSLNLPALDTAPTPIEVISGSGGTGSSTPSSAPNTTVPTGCTVTGTLLKTATCQTQKSAQDFSTACTTGSGNVPFFTTAHKATCGTEKGNITGPYAFADMTGFWSTLLLGYSKYQPIASTQSNPDNGKAVLQFASTCTADHGTTCLSSSQIPCLSSVVNVVTTGTNSTSCWNIRLYCTDGASGTGGCSSNPEFKVVQTQ